MVELPTVPRYPWFVLPRTCLSGWSCGLRLKSEHPEASEKVTMLCRAAAVGSAGEGGRQASSSPSQHQCG